MKETAAAKTVTIVLDDRKPKVTFKGSWTRAELDKAYRLTLKALGEHIMDLRRQDLKKKEARDE